MNKWICSDPDCAQYYHRQTDYVYSFVEVRESMSGFHVCHAVVDVRDYTIDELWQRVFGYYVSFEEIVSAYGFRESFHIIAECVFEQLGLNEMGYVSEKLGNLGAAIKRTHEWMNQN